MFSYRIIFVPKDGAGLELGLKPAVFYYCLRETGGKENDTIYVAVERKETSGFPLCTVTAIWWPCVCTRLCVSSDYLGIHYSVSV